MRRLEKPTQEIPSPSKSPVQLTGAPPVGISMVGEAGASTIDHEASQPLQFAGMRPRSLNVEKGTSIEPPEKKQEAAKSSIVNADDVVNPAILSASAAPGRKLSWKDKLKARKIGARSGKNGPPASEDGLRILPKKEISLVPDFAAQKREQQADKLLDKSEWRTKVVFGMGSSKRTSP